MRGGPQTPVSSDTYFASKGDTQIYEGVAFQLRPWTIPPGRPRRDRHTTPLVELGHRRGLKEKGVPNTEIARMLEVTEGAVRYHVERGAESAVDGHSLQPQKATKWADVIGAWMEKSGDRANLAALHPACARARLRGQPAVGAALRGQALPRSRGCVLGGGWRRRQGRNRKRTGPSFAACGSAAG